MSNLFSGVVSFNQDISGWDVSNVTDMSYMFNNATAFKQDISGWDISSVIDHTGFSSGTCLLYKDYHPDQTLADAEDVISPPIVTREELDTMIENGDDVTYINTSQITDMSDLFYNNSSFNQDISGWDVSNVTRMSRMFFSATSFNQDISNWDVSSVTRMEYMFYRAEVFNQDLSNWDVDNVNYNFHSEFATYSDLSSENYPDWK